MKVKIPKTIKVGATTYKIAYMDDLQKRHGKTGQAELTDGLIWIDNEIKSDEIRLCVLLHELMHCVDFVFMSYQLDDKQTDILASGIACVLTDLGIEFDWSEIDGDNKTNP